MFLLNKWNRITIDFSKTKQIYIVTYIMQMFKPCTYIIIIQIMINNAKLHSITIYKHEMDVKLYALTFKV
jgi:hypothetical protein